MEAIKLCRLDTPIIFIEARINLSRFVVTGCAAKTSATVTFPRSEERFSRNAETDLVCRLLLEKKKNELVDIHHPFPHHPIPPQPRRHRPLLRDNLFLCTARVRQIHPT